MWQRGGVWDWECFFFPHSHIDAAFQQNAKAQVVMQIVGRLPVKSTCLATTTNARDTAMSQKTLSNHHVPSTGHEFARLQLALRTAVGSLTIFLRLPLHHHVDHVGHELGILLVATIHLDDGHGVQVLTRCFI